MPVKLAGRGGGLRLLALVDTGFDGAAAVPPETARRLDLRQADTTHLTLADGTVVAAPGARARLAVGDSPPVTCRVVLLGDEVILGMALLDGHRLTVDCRDGGPVTIAPLPQ